MIFELFVCLFVDFNYYDDNYTAQTNRAGNVYITRPLFSLRKKYLSTLIEYVHKIEIQQMHVEKNDGLKFGVRSHFLCHLKLHLLFNK